MFNKKNQVITALVTPFTDEGKIDFNALEKLIDFQIRQSVDALVVLGTTAETPTLSAEEKKAILNFVFESVNGRLPLIVGCGTNCTHTTLKNIEFAQKIGADASLIVTPYYNNPSSHDIVAHYNYINHHCSLPFILYHVPSRTQSKLTVNDASKILDLERCVGLKDASNEDNWQTLVQKNGVSFFSGDDASSAQYCQNGANGVISVLSNLAPKGMKSYLINKDIFYNKLCNEISCETNPIPIKWLLYKAGLISTPNVRLPLQTLKPELRSNLDNLVESILELEY